MAHTFEGLKKKTAAELKEIAKGMEHPAVQGYTQMHKDKLLLAICEAEGIDPHAHHKVIGIDKGEIKGRIKALKERRAEALSSKNHDELKKARRAIHRLKRKIRRATV